MKFNEKLASLRKEKHFSQEELADKIGVSRQAVSKWESGISYPEMDKLLLICKIFDCNLEELTSERVSADEIKDKSYKSNAFVHELLDILSSTHDLFSGLGFFKTILLLFKIMVIGIVVFIITFIPTNIIVNLGTNFFTEFGRAGQILGSLWEFVIFLLFIVLFAILIFYIYKTMILDKYEIRYKNLDEPEEIDVKQEKKYVEVEKENVVVTNKGKMFSHTFNFLGKIFSFFSKMIIFFMLLFFIMMLVAFVILLTFDLHLMYKGVVFIGILIGIISGLLFSIILVIILSHLLASKKIKFKPVLISLMMSFVLCGISIGCLTIESTNLTIHTSAPEVELKTHEETIKYRKGLYISRYGAYVTYKEDNSIKNNDIKIKISYYSDYNRLYTNDNGEVYYVYTESLGYQKKLYNLILENLKNKELYDYDMLFYEPTMEIRANKKVLDALIKNEETVYEEGESRRGYQEQIEGLQSQIEMLRDENEDLQTQINNQDEIVLDYETKVKKLEQIIEDLQTKLSELSNYDFDYEE